jgi:hypothetical protein
MPLELFNKKKNHKGKQKKKQFDKFFFFPGFYLRGCRPVW